MFSEGYLLQAHRPCLLDQGVAAANIYALLAAVVDYGVLGVLHPNIDTWCPFGLEYSPRSVVSVGVCSDPRSRPRVWYK